MNAAEVLTLVENAGGSVEVDGADRLRLRAPAPLPEELVEEVRRKKPEILRVLRDGTGGADQGCGCLVCRPDLWPNGYEEAVSAWPARDRARYQEAVQARVNAGLSLEQAQRLSYLDGLADVRRRR